MFLHALDTTCLTTILVAAMADLQRLAPNTEETEQTQNARQGQRVITISAADLRRYLALASRQDGEEGEEGDMAIEDDDNDPDYEDEDDEDDETSYFAPSGTTGKWFEEVKEPKEKGLALLNGGEFGRLGHQLRSQAQKNSVARTLLRRGAQVRPVPREDITSVCSSPLFT